LVKLGQKSREVPLVELELIVVPEHMSSPLWLFLALYLIRILLPIFMQMAWDKVFTTHDNPSSGKNIYDKIRGHII
jgi:hypothetical protein